jgi:hypothetical protein
MSIPRAFLSAFGTSFALTLGGSGDTLAFGPEAGTSLTKTFTATSQFELDDLSLLVSGQDVAEMIGEVSFSIGTESKIEVSDTYKAVAGARPAELLRTFEDLGADVNIVVAPNPGGMEMPDMSSSSELEGKTVLFRWNEEEEAYDKSFADGDGDESLLEGLEEDMDLRLFLPASEVAPDDSWTVELKTLTGLMSPGGDLRLMPAGAEMDMDEMEEFTKLFEDLTEEYADQLEGDCTCTYRGTRDEDGQRVAEIAIEIEVSGAFDLTEPLSQLIQKSIEKAGGGVEVNFSFDSADLSMEFEGSGTLLWNPAAGLAHSFQISGDATLGLDLAVSIDAMGESQDIDASLEMSGTMEHALETKK